MSFASIFAQLAVHSDMQTHGLSDGQFSCRYAELPEVFALMDNFFEARQFSTTDCFALQFDNNLAGALVLLYLLARERHLFLAPKPQKLEALNLTPAFCRYRLSLSSEAKFSGDFRQLPTLLKFQEHPKYQDERDLSSDASGRLYLKTSGSMGVSKIVEHRLSSLLANAQNCVPRFRLSATDRVLIPVPIFHMYGLGAGLLPSLLAGAHLELLDKTNILKYLQAEKQFNPNVAFLTPSLCAMLLQGKRSDRAYSLVVSAGDKLRPEVFTEFAKRFGGLVNLYGSTELGAVITSDLADAAPVRAAYAGKPLPGVTTQLAPLPQELDNAAGVGELQLGYAQGFSQYLDANGRTLKQHGATDWFATGDLARIHASGYVEVLGRSGLSINRRGYLVVFSEVEQRLESLPGVEKAVLVATAKETDQGRGLVAFCLTHDATLQAATLRQACFALLPNYAIPDQIQLLSEFPLLPSGKIDRQSLLQLL